MAAHGYMPMGRFLFMRQKSTDIRFTFSFFNRKDFFK